MQRRHPPNHTQHACVPDHAPIGCGFKPQTVQKSLTPTVIPDSLNDSLSIAWGAAGRCDLLHTLQHNPSGDIMTYDLVHASQHILSGGIPSNPGIKTGDRSRRPYTCWTGAIAVLSINPFR